MENKNEIGKLFKGKLELLDKSPSKDIWASIESDLDKKRKRRVLFWLIPILLTTALTTATLFFTQVDEIKNNPSEIAPNQTGNTPSKSEIKSPQKTKSEIANSKKITVNNKIESNPEKLQKVSSLPSNASQVNPQQKKTRKQTTRHSSETKITNTKNRTEKLVKQSTKLIVSTDEYEEYEVVKKYKVVIKKNKTVTTTHTNSKKTSLKTPQKKKIATSKKKTNTKKYKKNTQTKKVSPIPASSKEMVKDTINSNSIKKDAEEKSIADSQITEPIKKDSIVPKPEKKPTVKREYVKKVYATQKKESKPEYFISAYYGPAIFGSLANESTINKTFSDFSKSRPVTSHYGVYFKSMYGKIGFRVGVAKINLKTSTSVNDPSTLKYENITLKNYNSADINTIIRNDDKGQFEQKISYYEMPLEFNYALKKDENPFGMDAFTGFSILILDDNQLSFSSDSFKNRTIGKIKNLSETNLSFNFGVGFNYKLTKKIQIDFNPIFKYYLNTFNENNTAQPYSLSIQSGATYKF